MSTQGYLLEAPTSLEVVSAYGVPKRPVPSQSSPPGWYVIGGFFLPKGVLNVQFEILAMVNDAALEMHARLFNVNDAEPVTGSQVTITNQAYARVTSGLFNLTGIRHYQVQAEAIHSSPTYNIYGIVDTASITDGI